MTTKAMPVSDQMDSKTAITTAERPLARAGRGHARVDLLHGSRALGPGRGARRSSRDHIIGTDPVEAVARWISSRVDRELALPGLVRSVLEPLLDVGASAGRGRLGIGGVFVTAAARREEADQGKATKSRKFHMF